MTQTPQATPTPQASFWKRRWKLVVNLVTLVALVVLVFAIRDQIMETFQNLTRVNAWLLLLMLPIEFLNYDAQTRLYRSLFKIVGNKLRYWFLYRAALELNFVNNVFPSGGVTGLSYFGVRMRDGENISTAKATVVQLLKLVLLFLSFEILIVLGVFLLAIEGHMNSLVLLLAGSLTTILVIGTAAFAFIIGSKKRISGTFKYLTIAFNRVVHVVRPKHPETISLDKVEVLFDDLHNNYMLISKDWRMLKRPLLWALMANFWEIMALYTVYMAFGEFVNFGAVILAYAVANFAGLISVLPGGIGVYEGLMTLTLSATGVPSRVSLPVTVMYRVLNTLIQLPIGYFFYHKTLRETKAPVGASNN